MAGEFSQDYVCDECGMAYAEFGADELEASVRAVGPRWRELVTGVDDAALRTRPDPETWSALEYGWHLGSGLDWMASALTRMAEEDVPDIDWLGHEQDVAAAAPNDRDLDGITTRLDRGASRLAAVLAELAPDAWEREADFVWGRRDLLDMARNAAHEGEHHLYDVGRVLDATTSQ